jgi:hypothetical protein
VLRAPSLMSELQESAENLSPLSLEKNRTCSDILGDFDLQAEKRAPRRIRQIEKILGEQPGGFPM